MTATLQRLSFILFSASYVAAIWPLPASLSSGSSALILSTDFDVILPDNAPRDLADAVGRTKQFLSSDALGRLVPDRGASDKDAIGSAPALGSLVLTVTGDLKSIAEVATAELGSRDEAYTLTVPDDGSDATLSANSSLGLLRGLSTFEQLWYTNEAGIYTVEAPFDIEDGPVYPYRGFMLDTARNYFPVDDIKRTLDAMSWVKMTTFHWHVVDSQSFPLQIPGFLELSEAGAYTAEMVYTPENVADIVAYANARGIDVMVEWDTPGHTSVISKSHPEHVACPEASPWASYAAEPPSGQLRIASAETTNFTTSVVTALSGMFNSKYLSLGGDEINAKCYTDDAETQASLNGTGKDFATALSEFTNATHNTLRASGKTPVVWQEMVLDYNVTTVEKDALILVWISSEDAISVVEQGYKIIHAASDYFYLDCGLGGWVGDNVEGNSWCDPFKTWQKSYSFDPVANMTSEQAELVLGGQHLIWTEQTSPANLDSSVWPRAASSAEVFWSGPGGNVTSALPRLHDLAYRFNQRGVAAIALQPIWCALRPYACDLTA
ncbi:glycoside hydrolase family 20 protein [Cylindrobasidium torrendii FP15055 ss-10]|uniref:Beta-hexosaminidase n=1 Tax=Cylindrobasidium torrendii FP15055 ss-10 TaxID=1314674 RepID=A0A0D7BFN5_9AGAR|nr:glycoside hydrolase family 20 protein [Cylindrobasidium torrendii FP15055 ss-10]